MACVDAIGQVDSVLCLCCSRSFLKSELPGHVTRDHFCFLPFACTSCDFTAASEREVLDHAKEKRHIPYAVDHSSSKPYLTLLIRLVVSHCKTFAQTSDFEAILAELNSQIAAHENGFNGGKSQPFILAETPQQQDYESSSERSVSTVQSAQNVNACLRYIPAQYDGANSESGIFNTKQQLVSATLTSKARLPKQKSAPLRACQSSKAVPKQGLANKRANASTASDLCASNKQLKGHEKQGHVLQHLDQGAASRSDHQNTETFFAEVAATRKPCFAASGELAGADVPAGVEDVVAMQRGHMPGGFANDINRFFAQVLREPNIVEDARDENSSKERPYPDRRRSSWINSAADVIARSPLISVAEDMDVDRLDQNTAVLPDDSDAVAPARDYECRICSARLIWKPHASIRKQHAMRKHFTTPQVFECSKCGYGSNVWFSEVTKHVRRAHPGQQGKDVRVIDRSVELANKIHACLEACFPGGGFAPPPSKGGANENDGYHHADSGGAAGHSSDNLPHFDLPGPSGYHGPELGHPQEFKEVPLVGQFDKCEEEDGFVNVAVKAEPINDSIVATSFIDIGTASAFSLKAPM